MYDDILLCIWPASADTDLSYGKSSVQNNNA